MEALKYLQDFYKTNPTLGAILSGAVACFAAVITIVAFGVDIKATIPAVLYVLAIGVPLYLLVRLFDDDAAARRAAGLFVALLVVLWIVAFFWSRSHLKNAELACAVYFWQPCVITVEQVADATAEKPKLDQPISPSTPSDLQKGQYQVYIQFAGYDRTTIVDLAGGLVQQGWNVQDPARGGERLGAAANLAEVRYRDASAKPAADALASALNASKIAGRRAVKSTQNAVIRPNTLEVWIGQP